MTDKHTPPDWVLIEAAKRSGYRHWSISEAQHEHNCSPVFRALCDMTAENERLREYLDRIAKAWPIEPTEEWIKLTQPYRDMANEGLAKEHTDGT